MRLEIVEGDLLRQEVEVIVNGWHRNVLPSWMTVKRGVSVAIRQEAGARPFRELARHGAIPLGAAVLTSAGELPHRGIIHVAAADLLFRSSEGSIRASASSAIDIARTCRFRTIAFPVLGTGTTGLPPGRALNTMRSALEGLKYDGAARIVVRHNDLEVSTAV